MSFDIFVSYSSADRAKVTNIVSVLEEVFLVWWDRDLINGSDFAEDIFSKMERSVVVVIAWSASAAASDWVRREICSALQGQHRVIPLLLDLTPLPEELRQIDAANLREWNGEGEPPTLEKVVRDIRLYRAETAAVLGAAVEESRVGAEPGPAPAEKTDKTARFLGYGLGAILTANAMNGDGGWYGAGALMIWVGALLYVCSAPLRRHKAESSEAQGDAFARAKGAGRQLVAVGVALFLFSGAIGWTVHWGAGVLEQVFEARIDPVAETQRAMTATGNETCQRIEKNVAIPTQNKIKVAQRLGEVEDQGDGWKNNRLHINDQDEYYASGCVQSDWFLLVQDSADELSAPMFVAPALDSVEWTSRAEWASQVPRELDLGHYDNARLILRSNASVDAAAANLLAVLDVLSVGHDASPERAHVLFKAAASAGNLQAMANLGLTYIFGIGTPVNVEVGTQLLNDAMSRGLALKDATWLLVRGNTLMRATNFVEAAKVLDFAARSGSSVARVILGMMAAQGFSHPACRLPCTAEIGIHAKYLREAGWNSYADFVETNRLEVRFADRRLPGVAGMRAVEARQALLEEIATKMKKVNPAEVRTFQRTIAAVLKYLRNVK